jgi:hypothetical protein
MKNLVAFALAAVLTAACRPTFAADSMHGSMMMPTCAAGDPVVGVNMKTKMYMSHDQMKTKMMGMSMEQQHAMMKSHHVMMMCKSKADAMGGHMMMAKPM